MINQENTDKRNKNYNKQGNMSQILMFLLLLEKFVIFVRRFKPVSKSKPPLLILKLKDPDGYELDMFQNVSSNDDDKKIKKLQAKKMMKLRRL